MSVGAGEGVDLLAVFIYGRGVCSRICGGEKGRDSGTSVTCLRRKFSCHGRTSELLWKKSGEGRIAVQDVSINNSENPKKNNPPAQKKKKKKPPLWWPS